MGLWVPPRSFKREGPSARSSAGNTVCTTRVMLPAV